MTTPAGWYDDPGAPGSGQLRWWDGTAWTSHVRPGQQAEPQQPQYGQAQQAQPQRPQYGQQRPYGEQPQYQQQTQQYSQQQYTPAPPAQGQGYQGYQTYPAQPGYTGYGTYGGKPTATPDAAPLANVWLRLVAKIIDGIILGIITAILLTPFWGRFASALGRYIDEANRAAQSGKAVDPFTLYGDPGYYQFQLAAGVIGLVVSGLYVVLLLRFKGATVGKMIFGMRVRRWENDERLGWGNCLARWASESLIPQITCGLFFFIDSLWCLWDPRRQTLHDKIARTVVTTRR